MSDAALDKGFYFPSPMTDWYRERPFKVAFVASLLIHAALIALVPGFRAVVFEPPKVLNVEIILPEEPLVRPMPLKDVVPPAPVTTPPPPQRTVEETVVQPEPQIEPRPEPVLRQPEPEPPPIPRAEIAPPRPEPAPEPVVVPKPEPRIEPKIEITPEPRIEPRPEPPPVARVEPLPEPRTEVRPEPLPVPRVEPPPPPVAEATVQSPAVAAPTPPQPVAPKAQPESVRELALVQKYKDSISTLIRSHKNYPIVAKRRGWEGTTVVGLTLAPDGNVKSISVIETSGRDILDQAALTMVKRAGTLPRAPEELRGQERTVRVPISFKLQDS
jgi:protein TonB